MLVGSGMSAALLSAFDHYPRLRELRDEFAARAAGLGKRDPGALQDAEWSRLSLTLRMVVLIAAGIDGDTKSLASQRWQRFTPAERERLTLQMRAMKRELQPLRMIVL